MTDQTITRKIAGLRRLNGSANGNPAFTILFTDGLSARTQTDTGWAYAVDSSMIGQTYRFTMTAAGRIRFGEQVSA